MNIKEAFYSVIKPFEVDEEDVELALLNAGLDGSVEYNASLQSAVEKSSIDLMFQVISVTSESESQYSTSKDAKLLRERLLFFARKHGRKDITNALNPSVKVKNISRMR